MTVDSLAEERRRIVEQSIVRVEEFEAQVGFRSEARKAVGDLGALTDILEAKPGSAKRRLIEALIDDAEQLYELRLRQFTLATEPQRRRLLEEIADGMIAPQPKGFMPLSARKELVATFDAVPADIVARLEANGVRFSFDAQGGFYLNADRGVRWSNIRLSQTTTDHEFAHAIDHLLSSPSGRMAGRGNLLSGSGWRVEDLSWRADATRRQRLVDRGAGMSRRWDEIVADGGNRRVLALDGHFRMDGEWVDRYDSKLYTFDKTGGTEFWSMNSERYLGFKRASEALFDDLVSEGVEAGKARTLTTKALRTGRRQDVESALRSSLGPVRSDRVANRLASRLGGPRGLQPVEEWRQAIELYGKPIRQAMEETYGKPNLTGRGRPQLRVRGRERK